MAPYLVKQAGNTRPMALPNTVSCFYSKLVLKSFSFTDIVAVTHVNGKDV